MARGLAQLPAPVLVALLATISAAAAQNSSRLTDAPWSEFEEVPDIDGASLFHECEFTTRVGALMKVDPAQPSWKAIKEDSGTWPGFYPRDLDAQGLGCTPSQRTEQTSGAYQEYAICDAASCPDCDGTRMSQTYCAELCTRWFVRDSAKAALERYVVLASIKNGDECWCTPRVTGHEIPLARSDDEHDRPPYPVCSECGDCEGCGVPCAGARDQVCGGREEQVTVVQIGCHSNILYVVVAMAPFLSRFFLDGLYGCWAWIRSCRSSPLDDQGFTMTNLCSGNHNSWENARVANGRDDGPIAETKQALWRACFIAAFRLAWHLAQPCIFLGLLLHYSTKQDMMDTNQIWLGWLVAVREAFYFVTTLFCLWLKPSFLLVNVRASIVNDQGLDEMKKGWRFLLMYLFAPEKFVATVLFQPRGLGTDTLQSIRQTVRARPRRRGFHVLTCDTKFSAFADSTRCVKYEVASGGLSHSILWGLPS